MLFKKISSGDIKMIEDPKMFAKGTKFVFGGKVGTVIEAREADNTQMRRIVYDDGTDEVVTLQTLLKDSQSPGFTMLPDIVGPKKVD